MWNKFRVFRRTDNVVEGWNASFNRQVAVAHPSLYTLIENLRADHEDRSAELNYWLRFKISSRLPSAADDQFNAFLLSIWNESEDSSTDPMDTLFAIVRNDLSSFDDAFDDESD